jgi:putative tricarboxylic transport membrane protein
MIEGILIGLTTALTFQNILMVMVGCFFGTIIGMLPGLGPMTAIALMIPITYGFDPATGLILRMDLLNKYQEYHEGDT